MVSDVECVLHNGTLVESVLCVISCMQGARHVAKDIVGMGIANPIALLLSTSMLLRHLQLHSYADRHARP